MLPFMGKKLALVKSGLVRSYINGYHFVRLKLFSRFPIVWQIILALKMLFLNFCALAKFVILICRSRTATYTGKTFRHMKARFLEHQGVLPWTDEHLKGTLSTFVRDHILDCDHVVAWHDFKVLWRESNHWVLEIKESLFIQIDRSQLNKNINSQELFLF